MLATLVGFAIVVFLSVSLFGQMALFMAFAVLGVIALTNGS